MKTKILEYIIASERPITLWTIIAVFQQESQILDILDELVQSQDIYRGRIQLFHGGTYSVYFPSMRHMYP